MCHFHNLEEYQEACQPLYDIPVFENNFVECLNSIKNGTPQDEIFTWLEQLRFPCSE